ncbi:MAG: TIGR03905 family TSCPD domain-containing protein [Deltaproteobacteria bacterium]|jgi:uncharacterized protein (TIGR03905 family)|nr:TIGR03905 family TSCPD domain-containing protein [Deltaproteobacteria bacterium]
MRYQYKTKRVCSKAITFEINDGLVSGVKFDGGCDGNLKGISLLTEGRPAAEVAEMLAHVKCKKKSTSCPAQLSLALKEAIKKAESESIKQTDKI